MNPALAPRARACAICRRVSAIEDVNVRLFDVEGRRQRPASAIEYLRSVGYAGTDKALRQSLANHARHVAAFLGGEAKVTVIAPIDQDPVTVTRVQPLEERERARWLDVQQNAMDLGMDALRSLSARLAAGDLDSKEEIALAKLGVTAAAKRADISVKGGERDPLEALLRLTAGLSPDA